MYLSRAVWEGARSEGVDRLFIIFFARAAIWLSLGINRYCIVSPCMTPPQWQTLPLLLIKVVGLQQWTPIDWSIIDLNRKCIFEKSTKWHLNCQNNLWSLLLSVTLRLWSSITFLGKAIWINVSVGMRIEAVSCPPSAPPMCLSSIVAAATGPARWETLRQGLRDALWFVPLCVMAAAKMAKWSKYCC